MIMPMAAGLSDLLKPTVPQWAGVVISVGAAVVFALLALWSRASVGPSAGSPASGPGLVGGASLLPWVTGTVSARPSGPFDVKLDAWKKFDGTPVNNVHLWTGVGPHTLLWGIPLVVAAGSDADPRVAAR